MKSILSLALLMYCCATQTISAAPLSCSCQNAGSLWVHVPGEFFDYRPEGLWKLQCVEISSGRVTKSSDLDLYPSFNSCSFDARRYEGQTIEMPQNNEQSGSCQCQAESYSAHHTGGFFFSGVDGFRMICVNSAGRTTYDTRSDARYYPTLLSCQYDGRLKFKVN